MLRKSALLLPLLLSLPFAVSAQSTKKELSPALRAKLLAQNSKPASGAAPAGAPAPTPADAALVPAALDPTNVPAADAKPAGAPATGATPVPGTTPTPGPGPGVPRRTIPLPGGRTPGNSRSTTPGSTRAATPANPSAVPAGTNAAPEEESGNPWEHIEFLDATVSEVIDKYEEITRRHVIRGPNVGTATVTLRANHR